MGDNRTGALPEGTDTVIQGAAKTQAGETPRLDDTTFGTQREIPGASANAERSGIRSGGPTGGFDKGNLSTTSSSTPNEESEGGIVQRIKSGREQLSSQAGEKARGLVSQGLERTSEALANVARIVGDTASGIEERLGADYGDYARRAADSIENVANTIASKNPDELIEDTRNFVRNSPGIALAGAAVVGFVVVRLVKTGLTTATNSEANDES